MVDYNNVIGDLRTAYDGAASGRNAAERIAWKVAERQRFLDLLEAEKAKRLLEIGAGTGQDSLFFRSNGLDVVATDLSPEHVRLCRDKGLEAHVMDFLGLNFLAASFDAVYAFNCLLHVPSADFLAVLKRIDRVLRPSGAFFLGQYGGVEREGSMEDDRHVPPRFFRTYSDDNMRRHVSDVFDILNFTTLRIWEDPDTPGHFQSIHLRSRARR
ncbi:MAG: class I SAM-dependent methyltransferase [SAR202 cluster bacterium]|jgi:SAM-dependent methyltransferase|nr:SAM-dependent methyltransferase [Chloroflexota bacterium]MDP6422207.1 class I SAM-dependent methyltransferase [SAR202 cluster bacterium]HAL46923.1 SAM-dependent methyltransferase [Dehalococcoidia bacterium]MDP6663679.1 class I SAM-dependent methyltransferase [SAR202 cluster bacterium]MDP6800831.1 class I SAM-dependent methyltransferase [SAR202 cluster bacterium]|tara:strand:+ start:11637 stop:12275 length:639 start_codon:yes stop_codon:yes gene_type:complete